MCLGVTKFKSFDVGGEYNFSAIYTQIGSNNLYCRLGAPQKNINWKNDLHSLYRKTVIFFKTQDSAVLMTQV